jgi:hypothetical protein
VYSYERTVPDCVRDAPVSIERRRETAVNPASANKDQGKTNRPARHAAL